MEYTNSQMCALIAEHIHSRRDREILSLKLIEGMTFERIAETVDMSTVQVKRIVKRERGILFSHLNDT